MKRTERKLSLERLRPTLKRLSHPKLGLGAQFAPNSADWLSALSQLFEQLWKITGAGAALLVVRHANCREISNDLRHAAERLRTLEHIRPHIPFDQSLLTDRIDRVEGDLRSAHNELLLIADGPLKYDNPHLSALFLRYGIGILRIRAYLRAQTPAVPVDMKQSAKGRARARGKKR